MDTYPIPEYYKKTVVIPVRIINGRLEWFYKGKMPEFKDEVIADLIVPHYAIKDKEMLSKLSDERVVEILPKQEGLVHIFVPHQTCAVSVLEYEPGLVQDLKGILEKLVPDKEEYEHNLKWGDGNGAAHLKASLLKPSLTVPLENGKLCLGTWQQIILMDFDNRPRQRQIFISVLEGTNNHG